MRKFTLMVVSLFLTMGAMAQENVYVGEITISPTTGTLYKSIDGVDTEDQE